MYSHGGTRNENDDTSLSDTRLSVADILSSMANSSGETTTGTTTFSTLDGLTSGIPTRTTPTLTPTTLKNIEESFLDLQSIPPAPMEHQHQAGFVPPVVNISVSTSNSQNGSNLDYHSQSKHDDEDLWLSSSCVQSPGELSPTSSVYQSDTAPCTTTTSSKGRNMGGRRPNRNDSLTPEEEERRRVRRERNKLAAARCRKRRMDHTNNLLKETEGLEEKRHVLQQEIQLLKSQKEELEFLLEAHKATCKMIKHHQSRDCSQNSSGPEISNVGRSINSAMRKRNLNRPTSLAVSSAFVTQDNSSNMKVSTSVVTGVPISTPSTGMFNFESLMEGGTGLTPVSTGLTPVVSSCSGQQRNSSSDLSSPDGVNPPKLVSL